MQILPQKDQVKKFSDGFVRPQRAGFKLEKDYQCSRSLAIWGSKEMRLQIKKPENALKLRLTSKQEKRSL